MFDRDAADTDIKLVETLESINDFRQLPRIHDVSASVAQTQAHPPPAPGLTPMPEAFALCGAPTQTLAHTQAKAGIFMHVTTPQQSAPASGFANMSPPVQNISSSPMGFPQQAYAQEPQHAAQAAPSHAATPQHKHGQSEYGLGRTP